MCKSSHFEINKPSCGCQCVTISFISKALTLKLMSRYRCLIFLLKKCGVTILTEGKQYRRKPHVRESI